MTTPLATIRVPLSCVALAIACSLAASQSAFAVPIETEEANNSADGFDAAIAPSLITTGQPSLAGVTASRAPSGPFFEAGLIDGSANAGDAVNTMTWYDGLDTSTAEITFDLSGAYNISNVQVVSGWPDSYFGSHQFTLSFEFGDSGIFAPVGAFGTSAYTPIAPPPNPEVDDDGYATRTTVTDNAGFLGSNVTGVRFLFTDPYPEIPQFNGSVLREISVVGAPVPEPSTLALLAACLPVAGFALRRSLRKQ